MNKYPANIFELVRTLRDDFLKNYVEIVPGYRFNQYETIKKIHKYYNSQFDGDNYETINGVRRKKTFFNINKWRCMVATKMIDRDVKDFLMFSSEPSKERQVELFRKVTLSWMKKSKLGKILNEVVRKLPIYGSVVLEKTKNGANVVDLRYLMNDQSVTKLEDSWVIIKDLMSAGDLRKMTGIWDNVEEAIDKHCNYASKSYEDSEELNQAALSPYAEVYRFHGEVPLSWFTDKQRDDNTWVKARWFVTGIGSENNRNNQEEGLVLYKEQITEYPFKEVHYDRTEGRWLGIGVVEDTFEAQRRTNEIKNQEAKALELGSMILLQTQDQTAVTNVLSDVDNGDIIRSQNGIQRVDNVNRAMPDFNASSTSYDQLADRTTFSYDVVRGEGGAASATLGAVQLQTQQAISVYDYHREDVDLFLNEYFKDLVFPQIEKDLQKDYDFSYVGSVDEVNKLREEVVESLLEEEYSQMYTPEMLSAMSLEELENLNAEYEANKEKTLKKLQAKWGNKLWFTAVKDYFKGVSKYTELEIGGEGTNVGQKLQNVQYFLTTIAQNPDLLNNPVLKGLMFKVMGLIGMDSTEIELLQKEAEEKQSETQQGQAEQGGQMAQMQQMLGGQQTQPQLNA